MDEGELEIEKKNNDTKLERKSGQHTNIDRELNIYNLSKVREHMQKKREIEK